MNGNAKVYYSISEVCGRTGLEPHVLRYWESEFSQLRPKKNRAGNRAYRIKDITIINYIKYLLYEEKFTIPGAKKKLASTNKYEGEQFKPDLDQSAKQKKKNRLSVDELKRELTEVLRLLKQ